MSLRRLLILASGSVGLLALVLALRYFFQVVQGSTLISSILSRISSAWDVQ